MIGSVKVLLVKVSVVVRPTNVSVTFGKVNIPVFNICAMMGNVNVLLDKVSVVVLPTNVSVITGNVNVPVFDICEITGNVNVLPVNVCVADKETNVSVISGNVIVRFNVWIKFNVDVVPVVALNVFTVVLFVESVASIINVLAATRDFPLNVSVVARPTSVSVVVGNVKVPVFDICEMIGNVNVFPVNVSVVARPTRVSVVDGNVNIPVFDICAMIGNVKVFPVNVSVVALPTNVSVVVGNVSVPVFDICVIIGKVKVLDVNVCVAVNETNVSVISGNVIVLFTVCAKFNVDVVPVDALATPCNIFFVLSVASIINVLAATSDFPLNKSIVALPTNVSVVVGSVKVPVFTI